MKNHAVALGHVASAPAITSVVLVATPAVKRSVVPPSAVPLASASAAAPPIAAPSAASASAPVSAASEDEWSAVQQSSLELALRSVGNHVPDRWDVIAAAVPGKKKKQVMARFKSIKAQIIAAAAAAK